MTKTESEEQYLVQIKTAFFGMDLPEGITWLTDDHMEPNPKNYVSLAIEELEGGNVHPKRKKEIIRWLRKIYKWAESQKADGKECD